MYHTATRKRPSSARFTNIFHTLRTKMGIKDSERHMVLKHCGALHRYIRTEMEFLDISSLGAAYQYAAKLSRSSNKRHCNLGMGTPHKKSQERVATTHRTKDRAKMDSIRTTSPRRKKIRTPERQRKIPGSGATSIRVLGITLMTVTQRNHWWSK